MESGRLDKLCVYACIVAVGLGTTSSVSTVEAASRIAGAVAGKVFHARTGAPLKDVRVDAHVITSNVRLPGVVSDDRGTFFLSDAPTGIYSLTLRYEGATYSVRERLDARFGMSFVLETCLLLEPGGGIATVSKEECRTGLLPEAQVVTLGPHRFFQSDPDYVVAQNDPLGSGPLIAHSELECLTHDQFPVLGAEIDPGPEVALARVYFRSDKYPDFYYVEMEGASLEDIGANFRATLPKPSPETERIIYYIEAIDQSLMNGRTEDYDPPITDGCRRDPAAWLPDESPGIVVGATQAGAPAVPPGFQAVGISGFVSAAGVVTTAAATAGGAGAAVGTSGLVIVVSGGAAAATGVGIAAGGEEEEASSIVR